MTMKADPEDVVVQVQTASTVRVLVKAPKSMTILWGEVRERNGEKHPQFLIDHRSQKQKYAKEYLNKVSSG